MVEFWYLWLIFALLVLVLLIVSQRAFGAAKKRQEIVQRQIKEIEEEKALRNKFKTLTADLIKSSDMPLLLDGVCANIQTRLEKEGDINKAFDLLGQNEKYAYTLKYLLEDSKDGLSEFFKKNGYPLISLAPRALKEIGSPLAPLVKEEYAMFNEEDESLSYDEERISQIDKEFADKIDTDQLYQQIKTYIESTFIG